MKKDSRTAGVIERIGLFLDELRVVFPNYDFKHSSEFLALMQKYSLPFSYQKVLKDAGAIINERGKVKITEKLDFVNPKMLYELHYYHCMATKGTNAKKKGLSDKNKKGNIKKSKVKKEMDFIKIKEDFQLKIEEAPKAITYTYANASGNINLHKKPNWFKRILIRLLGFK